MPSSCAVSSCSPSSIDYAYDSTTYERCRVFQCFVYVYVATLRTTAAAIGHGYMAAHTHTINPKINQKNHTTRTRVQSTDTPTDKKVAMSPPCCRYQK